MRLGAGGLGAGPFGTRGDSKERLLAAKEREREQAEARERMMAVKYKDPFSRNRGEDVSQSRGTPLPRTWLLTEGP